MCLLRNNGQGSTRLDGVVVPDDEVLVGDGVEAREAAAAVLEARVAPRNGAVAFVPLHQRSVGAHAHAAGEEAPAVGAVRHVRPPHACRGCQQF